MQLIASDVVRVIAIVYVVLDQDEVICAQILVLSKLRYIPEKNDHTKTYIYLIQTLTIHNSQKNKNRPNAHQLMNG